MEVSDAPAVTLDPARFCDYALKTIEASEGRRRRRKRDTTPDAFGLTLKRELLQRVVEARPSTVDFEGWLLEQVLAAPASGPTRAMCIEIMAEYEIACADPAFARWLMEGAPSDDAGEQREGRRDAGGPSRAAKPGA